MTDAMISDLNALQPVGINRGNMVRKVIDHLDADELLKIKDWPEPPMKRGLRRSKRYAVSDEAWAKVERLRVAGVPVFDLIRHGVAVYLSLPHDMLLRDDSILLDWKKQKVRRRQLRDRKTRQTVDLKRASTEMIATPILDSMGVSRDEYLHALSIRMRRGELGRIDSEGLARRFGLTDLEIARVNELAQEVHVGLSPPDRPGLEHFDPNALATEARAKLSVTATQGVARAEQARRQQLAANRARLALESLGPFPHVDDEAACRDWLERAGESLPKTEVDHLWRQFLSKRSAAAEAKAQSNGQAPAEAPTRAAGANEILTEAVGVLDEAVGDYCATCRMAPCVCPKANSTPNPHRDVKPDNVERRYAMDVADNGYGYVRDETKTLIGKFVLPKEPYDGITALPEAGIVELFTPDGSKQIIGLEPVSDEERILLGEALQDHAIYELIRLELEEKFAMRGDEPITEGHMVELYTVVRNRIFKEIDAGNLEGFSKDDAEAVFARTMLRLRKEFALPAFDLIDNGDGVPSVALDEAFGPEDVIVVDGAEYRPAKGETIEQFKARVADAIEEAAKPIQSTVNPEFDAEAAFEDTGDES